MTDLILATIIGGVIGILGSLIGSIFGILLNWMKESFQKKSDRRDDQFKNLYGPITYHLLMLKVIDINRKELIEEISNKPLSEDIEINLKRWRDLNPVNDAWWNHIRQLKTLFEERAGYIEKKHLKLVENLLDGIVKRNITQGGKSSLTTKERIEKIFQAIDALNGELFKG